MTLTLSACLSDETTLQKVPRVSTKKGKRVEIAVNEEELKLDEPVIHDLHSYGDGDFPQDVLSAGLKKEMQALKDFDVYEEVGLSQVPPDLAKQAIDTRFVTTWKGGECKARLVVKDYWREVSDKDDL